MSQPATTRMKVNPPLGLRPSLENRRLSELKIDPTYQRAIDTGPSKTLIRRIAMFWDWRLFQPLVVARRDDGSFYVVDGQHRLAGARMRRDMHDLPCIVTQYSGPDEEAAAFVAINAQRRPLGALELFKAALASGDAVAAEIHGMIKGAGLTIAPHLTSAAWKPGMIGNIGGVLNARKVHGAKATARALKILADAYRDEVLAYAGTIFPGLVATVAAMAEDGGGRADDQLLTLVLAGASQREWMKEIELRKVKAEITRPVAAFQVIRDAYREALDEAEAA